MATTIMPFLFVAIISFILTLTNGIPTEYNVGIGNADITGPAAEVNMVSQTVYRYLDNVYVTNSNQNFESRDNSNLCTHTQGHVYFVCR